ncbi:MAG: metallophosphoesterase family protein, partial [Caldilineaceae bacterium]
MRLRFLHMADVHLGNRQYGLDERADDFAAAFYHAIDHAIRLRVDFVLIAGDLFHQRQIDAMTLNQAVIGLSRLRAAGIAAIAVQGNHEIAHFEETISWVQFLSLQGLLVLLHPNLAGDPMQLTAYVDNRGSYVDVKPGVRVYGLHYTGAAGGKILARYAQAIADLPADQAVQADGTPLHYRIFLAHAGVQGVLVNDASSPSLSDWHLLNNLADYIALGHVHKPFDYEDKIYNPGSLESCAVDEVIWDDRGFLVVDVDTQNDPPHKVKRERSMRRPFIRLSLKVDSFATAEALVKGCGKVVEEEAERPAEGSLRPLVEFSLTGTLTFAHQGLDMEPIEALAKERLNAFYVLVKNLAGPLVAIAGDHGEDLTREQLEEI